MEAAHDTSSISPNFQTGSFLFFPFSLRSPYTVLRYKQSEWIIKPECTRDEQVSNSSGLAKIITKKRGEQASQPRTFVAYLNLPWFSTPLCKFDSVSIAV